MSVLEDVTLYLDDLQVLTKDSFDNYLEKPYMLLAKLLLTGLRVHVEKNNF